MACITSFLPTYLPTPFLYLTSLAAVTRCLYGFSCGSLSDLFYVCLCVSCVLRARSYGNR
jgi:hypothetical protein